jgi:hypothetical protein
MPSTLEMPQSSTVECEDLRRIESHLDQLNELLEPEARYGELESQSEMLTLASYRRDIAKIIDQAMAETGDWWMPEQS